MPACFAAAAAGGAGTVKPPTVITCGTPDAPSQLGAAAVPVPGNAWHAAALAEGFVEDAVSAAGRLFAWQSTQEPGCGSFAASRAAWYGAGPLPAALAAQLERPAAAAMWQAPQSAATSLVAVGALF